MGFEKYVEGAVGGVFEETEDVALVALALLVLVFEVLEGLGAALRDEFVPLGALRDADLDLGVVEEGFQVHAVRKEVVHADLVDEVVLLGAARREDRARKGLLLLRVVAVAPLLQRQLAGFDLNTRVTFRQVFWLCSLYWK